ncbi:MAG: DUF2283 domain-containing protein [Planctomycetes bacterium]|nr:DUF2283 domain-containing protein [Planctomycetota bacterium]
MNERHDSASDGRDFQVDYDSVADVVLVTFPDATDSFGVWVTDNIVVNIGIESRKIVGFELLQPAKNGIVTLAFDFGEGLSGAIRNAKVFAKQSEKLRQAAIDAMKERLRGVLAEVHKRVQHDLLSRRPEGKEAATV